MEVEVFKLAGRVIVTNPQARFIEGDDSRGYESDQVYSNGCIGYGSFLEALVNDILEFDPDIIGISSIFTLSQMISHDAARVIKMHLPEKKFIFFWRHPFLMNAHGLIRKDFADFVVRGKI